jgi:transcriptional regulator with XRE-family HTH domain
MKTLLTNNMKKDIGNALKYAREKLHLSQSDVASQANISTNYYARIERGEENFTIEVLLNLSKALNVKPGDILPIIL